jgi:hypothetical protein
MSGSFDVISIEMAGNEALASVAPTAGNQFPAMTYIVNSLTMSFTVPLNERASLRLYDYYEHDRINDWHYAGFNNTLVYGNSAYTDAGPQGYNTNMVGLFSSHRGVARFVDAGQEPVMARHLVDAT